VRPILFETWILEHNPGLEVGTTSCTHSADERSTIIADRVGLILWLACC
jgi:hypothetical protein